MRKRARTDVVQLKLRMRESLRARLAAEAKRNDVSLNTQIVTHLEAKLATDALEALGIELKDKLDQLDKRFDAANPSAALRTSKEKK